MARKGFGTVLTNLTLNDRFSALSDKKNDTKPQRESNPFWLNKPIVQKTEPNTDHSANGKSKTTHRVVKIKAEEVKADDKENDHPMDVVVKEESKANPIGGLSVREQIELANAFKRRAHLNLLLNEKKVFRSNYRYYNRGLIRPLQTIKRVFGNRINGSIHNFRSNRIRQIGQRFNRKPKVTKEELDYDLELYMARAGLSSDD